MSTLVRPRSCHAVVWLVMQFNPLARNTGICGSSVNKVVSIDAFMQGSLITLQARSLVAVRFTATFNRLVEKEETLKLKIETKVSQFQ